jgi:adenylylsulfate kinase-like enzyme
VDCDVETLEERDPKGLYARARAGEVRQLTGVQSPYEAPTHPDLRIDTRTTSVEESVRLLEDMLRERGLIL